MRKIFFLLLYIFLAIGVFGATANWTGLGGDGLWSTLANWDASPSGKDIVINGVFNVTMDVNETIDSLTINGGATLNFTNDMLISGGGTNNLVLTNGTINLNDKTLSISNNFTINTGCTFTATTGIVNLNGIGANFTVNAGSTFTSGNSTINFNANNIIFTPNGKTFNDLNFNNNTTIATGTVDSLTANGNFVITAGTLQSGSCGIILKKDFTNNSSFTTTTGSLTFSGNVAQNFNPNSSNYNNIILNTTDTVTQTNAIGNIANLTITAGTYNLNGQNAGTITTMSNNGVFELNGGETITITNKDTDSGIVRYKNTATIDATKMGNTFWNLEIDSGVNTVSLGTDITVNNDLTITSGILSAGTRAININGNFTNNAGAGGFSCGTGAINFNETLSATKTLKSGGSTVYNVTINKSSGGTVQLSDTITQNAAGLLTMTAGTLDLMANTFTLGLQPTLTAGQINVNTGSLDGSVNSRNINIANVGFTLANTSGTIKCVDFSLSNGTVNPGTGTITASGNVVVSGGTYNTGTVSTIEMTGGGTSINSSLQLSSLKVNSAGTVSISTNNLNLKDNLQITSGTFATGDNQLQVGGTATIDDTLDCSGQATGGKNTTVTGNTTGTGTLTGGGQTITLSNITLGTLTGGAGAINISGNTSLTNLNGGNGAIDVNGSLSATTFTEGAGNTNIGGAFTVTTFTNAGGTLIFDTTAGANINSNNQNLGVIEILANKTLTSSLTCSSLTINASTLTTGNNALTVNGNISQVGAGNLTCGNQAINVTGDVSLTSLTGGSGAIDVNGNLSLTSFAEGTGNTNIGGAFTVTTFTDNATGSLIFDTNAGSTITSNSQNLGNIQISENKQLADTLNCNNLTIDNTKTLDGNNQDINLNGSWTNNAGATGFTTVTGTVTFLPTNASINITGDNNFNNLTIDITSLGSAKTINFEALKTQTVGGNLILTGNSTKILTLTSTNTWNLSAPIPANQTVNYVNVSYGDALANDISASFSKNGGNNDNLGGSPHWVFPINSLVWKATAININWNDGTNWDLGFSPNDGDNVTIDPAANNPTINIATVILNNLTINATVGGFGQLSTGNNTLTVNGNLTINNNGTNYGTLRIYDPSKFTANTVASNTGTIEYYGVVTQPIDYTTYQNLVISGAGGSFSLAGVTTVNGFLTVSAGTLDASTNNISVASDVTINGGTLNATGRTVNVSGNWTHSSGTFTNASSTVIFDGAIASVNVSAETFNNLTLAKLDNTKVINATGIWTVNGTLTLTNCQFVPGNFTHVIKSSWDDSAIIFQATTGTISFTTNSLNITNGATNYFYNFDISVGGANTATLKSNININGNLSITTGTLDAFDAVGRTINLKGTWTNASTFTNTSSTVKFIGSSGGNQDITTGGIVAGKRFNNIEIATTGGTIVRLLSSLQQDAGGVLTMTSGTLNLNANTFYLGSNFSMSAGTLTIGTGTFNGFDGTATYYDITFDTGSTVTHNTGTLRGKNISILNAASYTVSSVNSAFSVYGDFILNNLASWTANRGNITMNGNPSNISCAKAINNFALSSTASVSQNLDLTVNGTFTANNGTTFNMNNFNLSVNGAFTLNNASTFTKGTATLSLVGVLNLTDSNIAIKQDLGAVSIATAGNVTMASDISMTSLTISGGRTLNVGNNSLTVSGDISNSGIINVNGMTAGKNINVGGNFSCGTFTKGTGVGTIVFNGAGAASQSFTPNSQSYINVIVSNANGTPTVTMTGTATMDNLTIDATTTFQLDGTGAICTLNINNTKTVANSGVFKVFNSTNNVTLQGSGGTANFTGTDIDYNSKKIYLNAINYSPTVDLNNLETIQLSGTCSFTTINIIAGGTFIDGGQTFNISGNWSNAGTATLTGTVNFNGVAQDITSGGTGATKQFNILNHNGTGTLRILVNDIYIKSNFTNSSNSFNLNSFNMTVVGTFNITGGTFDASTGTPTIYVGGNWSKSGGGVFTYGTSTVDFNVTGGNITNAETFYHLKTTVGSHSATAGNISVLGDLSLSNGTTLTLTNAYTLTVTGNTDNYGTITSGVGTGTQTYNGTFTNQNSGTVTGGSGVTAGVITFNNNVVSTGIINCGNSGNGNDGLVFNGTATFSLGSLVGNATTTPNIRFTGTSIDFTGLTTLTQNSNLIIFSGANNQDFNSGTKTFQDIQINKTSNTVTLKTNNLTLTGSLTITAGTLSANDGGTGRTITLGGSWSNSATFTHGNSSVIFNGTVNQTFTPGASNYYNIQINNTGGVGSKTVQVSGGDVTQSTNGVLTLTSGILDLNTRIWNLGANYSQASASGTLAIGTGTFNGFDGISYYDLSFSNGTVTHGTGILTGKNISITAGTYTCAGASVINVNGNFTLTTPWTRASSTIYMKDTGTINSSQQITNLDISPTSAKTVTINTNSLNIQGTLNINSNGTLDFQAASSLTLYINGTTTNRKLIDGTNTSGLITFNGALDSTTSGVVTAGSGGILCNGTANFTTGTLNGYSGAGNPNLTFNSSLTFGTFTHNNDKLIVNGGTFTTNNQQVYNLDITTGAVTLSGTLNVEGTLNIPSGSLVSGANAINIGKDGVTPSDFTISGTGSFTYAAGQTITFIGNQTQNFSSTITNFNNIVINKTNPTDTLTIPNTSGDITVNGSLTVTSGILIQNRTLTLANTGNLLNCVGIALNGTWRNNTGSTNCNITLGGTATNGNVNNLGTITFDGGVGKNLQIRSSVVGRQRDWNGSGSFTVGYVDVQDQTCISGTPAMILCQDGKPGIDSGDNINWFLGSDTVTLSGSVYIADELTKIGASENLTIVVSKSATVRSVFNISTDAAGDYSRNKIPMSAGDVIMVYENGASQLASTVSIASGASIASYNLYRSHVIIRNDNGGYTTNTNLDQMVNLAPALSGNYRFTVVNATKSLTLTSGYELYIWNNGNLTTGYSPDGDVTTQGVGGNIDIRGALIDNAKILTISGNWDNIGGKVTLTGTAIFNGAAQTINAGGITSDKQFKNLTHHSSATGSLSLTSTDMRVDNTFLNDGNNFNMNSLNMNVGGNFTISAGTTFTKGGVGNTLTFDGTGSFTFRDSAGSQNVGNVIINSTETLSIYNTVATTMTVDNLQIDGTLTTNSMNIDCYGNFTNNNTFNCGTGTATVSFLGNTAATYTLKSNGNSFHHVTINKTAASNTGIVQLNTNNLTQITSGILTMTSGTLDLNGKIWTLDSNLNLTGGSTGLVAIGTGTLDGGSSYSITVSTGSITHGTGTLNATNLTISNTYTCSGNSIINLNGNLNISGAGWTASTSKINFNTVATITTNQNLYNVEIKAGGGNTVTLLSNVTQTNPSILTMTSGTLKLYNGVTPYIWTLGNNFTMSNGILDIGIGTFTGLTSYDITFSSGTVYLGTSTPSAGTLTGKTISITGNVNYTNYSTSQINCNQNFLLDTTGTWVEASSKLNMLSVNDSTISVTAGKNLYDVTINCGAAKTVGLLSNVTQTIGGTLTFTAGYLSLAGYTWILGNNLTLTSGCYINVGTGHLNGNNGANYYNITVNSNTNNGIEVGVGVTAGTLTSNTLTIGAGGKVQCNGTGATQLNIYGNFTNNQGALGFVSANSSVNFLGAAATTYTVLSGTCHFYKMSVNTNGPGTLQMNDALAVDNILTMTAATTATLDLNTFGLTIGASPSLNSGTINLKSQTLTATGIAIIDNGTTIIGNGTAAIINCGDFTLTTGTINNIGGTSGITLNCAKFSINGAGTYYANNSTITATDNISITNGTFYAKTSTINAKANVSITGGTYDISAGPSLIDINGATPTQHIDSTKILSNLTINDDADIINNLISIDGNLVVSNTKTLTLTGSNDFTINNTGDGTIAGTLTTGAANFICKRDLTINATGKVETTGTGYVDITGNLSNSGKLLSSDLGATAGYIKVSGNTTNSDTISTANSDITLTGTISNSGTITCGKNYSSGGTLVANTGTITGGSGTTTFTGNVTNNGVGSITGGNGLTTFNGTYSGTGKVTSGSGGLLFISSASFSGGTLVGCTTSDPTLQFRNGLIFGTFTHNNDTISFTTNTQNFDANNQYVYDMLVSIALTLNGIAGHDLHVDRDINITGSFDTGINDLYVGRDFTNSGTFTYNTRKVEFYGNADSTINNVNSQFYNFVVNKTASSNSVTIPNTENDVTINGIINVISGVFIQDRKVTVTGTATIGANGEWRNIVDNTNSNITLNNTLTINSGKWTVTAGTNTKTITLANTVTNNSGTITFDGDDTNKTLLIRSSVGGTQRDWLGNGTFTVGDIDVQDQTRLSGTPFEILCIDSHQGIDSGNNINWFVGVVGVGVHGRVFTDRGTTGANAVNVRMIVHRNATSTKSYFKTTTDASGNYDFNKVAMVSGDLIHIHIDNSSFVSGYKGETVSISGGVNITGCDVYNTYVIARVDNAGNITNANLNTVLEGANTDMQYTYLAPHLTINNNVNFFVWNASNFNPSGNVTTQGTGLVEVVGTFTLGNNDLTDAGNLIVSGTMNDAGSGNITVSGNTINFTGGGFTNGTGVFTIKGGNVTYTTNNITNFGNMVIDGAVTTMVGNLNTNTFTINNTKSLNTNNNSLTFNGNAVINGTLNASGQDNTKTTTVIKDFTVSGTGVFTKGAGTLTFGGITNFTDSTTTQDFGHISILNTATLDLATVIQTDNITINGSGSFNNNGNTITISGNWLNNASGTATLSGIINFDGGTDQSITTAGVDANHDFVNFIHSGNAILTLNDNIKITGYFNNTAGTFNQNDKNITVASNFTLASGGLYNEGTTGVGILTFDGTTNITDSNATKQDISNVVLSGNVTQLSDIRMSTLTINNTFSYITGNFSLTVNDFVTNNSILNVSSQSNTKSTTIGGNVTNIGTFTSGDGAVSITGNVTSSGTFTSANGAVSITGNVTNSGTFTSGVGAISIAGSLTNTGSLISGTGNISVGGNVDFTSGTYTKNTNVFIFNGGIVQIFTPNSGDFGNVQTSTANTDVRMNGIATMDNLTIDNLTTFELNGGTAICTLNINNGKTITNSGNFKIFDSTNTVTLQKTAVGANIIFTGTDIDYNNKKIYLSGIDYQTNIILGTTETIQLSGACIFDNLTINDKGSFIDAGNATTFSGNIIINGTDSLNFGSINLSGTTNIAGNWQNSTNGVALMTGTIIFDGGVQTLISGGTDANHDFNILTHAGTNSLTLNTNDIKILSNFTNTTGDFVLNSLNMTILGNLTIGLGTTLNASAGSPTINLSGNWTDNGTLNSGTSFVIFDGSITQTINAEPNFANLIINKSGELDIAGNIKCTYFALYKGDILFTANQTLYTTGNFLAIGAGNIDTNAIDGWSPVRQKDPTSGYNGTINFGGFSPTVRVDGDFYVNGANLSATANWTLTIPDNNSDSVRKARAYGTMIVQYSQASVGWVSAAELPPTNPTDGGNNNQWDFIRAAISLVESVADDTIRVTFSKPMENTDNEIWTAITSGLVKYNGNAIAFTGSYIDSGCATSTNGTGDQQVIYLKAPQTWNTDASGDTLGNSNSTDRAGVHKTLIPNITFSKGTFRDRRKNQILPVANYSNVLDKCSPVLISSVLGTEAVSPDTFNYLRLTYSEPIVSPAITTTPKNSNDGVVDLKSGGIGGGLTTAGVFKGFGSTSTGGNVVTYSDSGTGTSAGRDDSNTVYKDSDSRIFTIRLGGNTLDGGCVRGTVIPSGNFSPLTTFVDYCNNPLIDILPYSPATSYKPPITGTWVLTAPNFGTLASDITTTERTGQVNGFIDNLIINFTTPVQIYDNENGFGTSTIIWDTTIPIVQTTTYTAENSNFSINTIQNNFNLTLNENTLANPAGDTDSIPILTYKDTSNFKIIANNGRIEMLDTTNKVAMDNANPVLMGVATDTESITPYTVNRLTFRFSEPMNLGGITTGWTNTDADVLLSDGGLGGAMTTAKTIGGFGSFDGVCNITTNSSDGGQITKDANTRIVTLRLGYNSQNNGYLRGPSISTPTLNIGANIFSPLTDGSLKDLTGLSLINTTTPVTINNATPWVVNHPTINSVKTLNSDVATDPYGEIDHLQIDFSLPVRIIDNNTNADSLDCLPLNNLNYTIDKGDFTLDNIVTFDFPISDTDNASDTELTPNLPNYVWSGNSHIIAINGRFEIKNSYSPPLTLDTARPHLLVAEIGKETFGVNNFNYLRLTFSEPILSPAIITTQKNSDGLTSLATGGIGGGLTTAGSFKGFGSFATGGNVVTYSDSGTGTAAGRDDSNTVYKDNDTYGRVFTIRLGGNIADGGCIRGTVQPSGVFTAVTNIEDLSNNLIDITFTPNVSGAGWKLATPIFTDATTDERSGRLNGFIDNVIIDFNESVQIYDNVIDFGTSTVIWNTTNYTVQTVDHNKSNIQKAFNLNLVENTIANPDGDTDSTPIITYDENSNFKIIANDGRVEMLNGTNKLAVDDCNPVITGVHFGIDDPVPTFDPSPYINSWDKSAPIADPGSSPDFGLGSSSEKVSTNAQNNDVNFSPTIKTYHNYILFKYSEPIKDFGNTNVDILGGVPIDNTNDGYNFTINQHSNPKFGDFETNANIVDVKGFGKFNGDIKVSTGSNFLCRATDRNTYLHVAGFYDKTTGKFQGFIENAAFANVPNSSGIYNFTTYANPNIVDYKNLSVVAREVSGSPDTTINYIKNWDVNPPDFRFISTTTNYKGDPESTDEDGVTKITLANGVAAGNPNLTVLEFAMTEAIRDLTSDADLTGAFSLKFYRDKTDFDIIKNIHFGTGVNRLGDLINQCTGNAVADGDSNDQGFGVAFDQVIGMTDEVRIKWSYQIPYDQGKIDYKKIISDLRGNILGSKPEKISLETAPPYIKETRAVVGSNKMYVEFNENVFTGSSSGQQDITTTDFDYIDNLGTSIQITGIQKLDSTKFIFTLSDVLDQNHIAENFISPKIGLVKDGLNNLIKVTINNPVSFIGINFFTGIIMEDYLHQGEGWKVTDFSGSEKISIESIKITANINVNKFAGFRPILYYDVMGDKNQSKFWYPNKNREARLVVGSNKGDNNWEFVIPSNDFEIKSGNELSFVFKIGTLYCYLSPHKLDSPNFTPYDANTFSVKLQDIKLQNNNVTILNNVINPNNNELTKLLYRIEKEGPVSIVVYDLAGDVVKVLKLEGQAAGDHIVSWDGRNENGKIVTRGVYFIRVRAPGIFNQIRKVLIVK